MTTAVGNEPGSTKAGSLLAWAAAEPGPPEVGVEVVDAGVDDANAEAAPGVGRGGGPCDRGAHIGDGGGRGGSKVPFLEDPGDTHQAWQRLGVCGGQFHPCPVVEQFPRLQDPAAEGADGMGKALLVLAEHGTGSMDGPGGCLAKMEVREGFALQQDETPDNRRGAGLRRGSKDGEGGKAERGDHGPGGDGQDANGALGVAGLPGLHARCLHGVGRPSRFATSSARTS